VWCEDKDPHTDCVMTAWKSKIRFEKLDAKMKTPAKQISNIMASLENYKSQQ
jgi:hypothetical protein